MTNTCTVSEWKKCGNVYILGPFLLFSNARMHKWHFQNVPQKQFWQSAGKKRTFLEGNLCLVQTCLVELLITLQQRPKGSWKTKFHLILKEPKGGSTFLGKEITGEAWINSWVSHFTFPFAFFPRWSRSLRRVSRFGQRTRSKILIEPFVGSNICLPSRPEDRTCEPARRCQSTRERAKMSHSSFCTGTDLDAPKQVAHPTPAVGR